MGNQLARQVEALAMDGQRLKGVTPSARLVLFTMALDAHDTGTKTLPPAYYFRGWAHLARVLGHDGIYNNRAGEQAVTRAIRQLTKAGLIERDDSARPSGWFAAGYRLTL